MDYLAVTRFNTNTWLENERYRERYNIDGACYATPVKIKDSVPYKSILYVFEMNNELNIIMGLGVIINTHSKGIKHNIYSNYDYNRYNYCGKLRLSREVLIKQNNLLLTIMEKFLFKSYTHYKRGYGIQIISDKKLDELKLYISKKELIDIVKFEFN